MRGSVAKQFRRQANSVARATIQKLSDPINVALNNELKTRERVDALESGNRRLDALEAFRDRSFLGRLKWLFQGK